MLLLVMSRLVNFSAEPPTSYQAPTKALYPLFAFQSLRSLRFHSQKEYYVFVID